MAEIETSGVPGKQHKPATPVDSGTSGMQITAVEPAEFPAPLHPNLQHTDFVASSMRGIGSVPLSPDVWNLGVANYDAVAHELRESKRDYREISGKLEASREENANLRVENERLKGKVPVGVLRTVTSGAFVTIGGMLVGLSFKESLGDVSLTLLNIGLCVLLIGWIVAMWRSE